MLVRSLFYTWCDPDTMDLKNRSIVGLSWVSCMRCLIPLFVSADGKGLLCTVSRGKIWEWSAIEKSSMFLKHPCQNSEFYVILWAYSTGIFVMIVVTVFCCINIFNQNENTHVIMMYLICMNKHVLCMNEHVFNIFIKC